MKSLTTPILGQSTATQSGWCELYDFYLKSPITTPFGTTSTLRLTTLPGGLQNFTPKVSPEPSGTQGSASAYNFWPLQRQAVTGSNKFANDKLIVTASNVTTDFAAMIAAVDWEGVAVVIRKISTSIAAPTADDNALIFFGLVDTYKVTNEQIQFTCSGDLGAFNVQIPRENMHTSCRFQWADDQCTAIRFAPANYKSKTAGPGSSTTDIKSADLTEDTGSLSSYGTDLIDALADAKITASSSAAALSAVAVTFASGPLHARFSFDDPINSLGLGDLVHFGGTAVPTGLTAGVDYYIGQSEIIGVTYYDLSTTYPAYTPIPVSSTGTAVTASTTAGFGPASVKNSNPNFWKFSVAADWGTLTQGYWQIPDAQAGLQNGLLKPWITFDFTTAVQPRLWRVQGIDSGNIEDLPRLILFFSSPDNATWNFETYFECPPLLGPLFDVLIPNATNARYWRICVRTRWSPTLSYPLFQKVYAYTGSRHYWAEGQLTFDGNLTAALAGVTRTVLESYAGELICAPLPVAPQSGDTFTLERGCPRTFNACAARNNTENFGGFDSLPYETIVR